MIITGPGATAVARPLDPSSLETVAVASFSDVQVTLSVMSLVLSSAYFPVAVNCCLSPTAIDAEEGVTSIDVSVGDVWFDVPSELVLQPPRTAIEDINESTANVRASDRATLTRSSIRQGPCKRLFASDCGYAQYGTSPTMPLSKPRQDQSSSASFSCLAIRTPFGESKDIAHTLRSETGTADA